MQSQSTSVIIRACSTHFQGVLTRRQHGSGRRISPSFFTQKRKQISIEDRGAATTLRTTICSSIWQFQRTVWRDSETQIRKKKIVGSASGSISIRMKEMGGAIIDHLRSKYPRQRPKTNRPTLHGKNETQFAPNCPGAGGGVGRHYPAPEFARWTRLAQTREVASETSRRDMVRPRIRRVRWAGSHAFSRARARGSGRARARSVFDC